MGNMNTPYRQTSLCQDDGLRDTGQQEGNRFDFCHHLLRELIREVISRQLTLQRLVNGG